MMIARRFPVWALAAAVLACHTPPRTATNLATTARLGDIEKMRAYIAAGADVNAFDARGNRWTPLLHAIHKGQRGSVRLLIASGADVNRASPHGLSPLEAAAGNGQADIVRQLLEAGADPREPGVFTTAVAGGAMSDIDRPLLGRCNTNVVRALLERAPDLRLPRNARGHLSLLFAQLNHCGDVLRLAQFG